MFLSEELKVGLGLMKILIVCEYGICFLKGCLNILGYLLRLIFLILIVL